MTGKIAENRMDEFVERGHVHQGLISDLATANSRNDLLRHPRYKRDKSLIKRIVGSPEVFSPQFLPLPSKEGFVRVAAWNIERGAKYEEVLQVLLRHEILSKADVILIQEVDCGMARSANRHIARDLSKDLGRFVAYGPEYLHFEVGNGAERKRIKESNTVALEGNAIVSRYPLEDVRQISLPHPKDQIAAREKKIGAQKCIAARVITPLGPVNIASVHLSAHSSRSTRRKQMQRILENFHRCAGPAIIGGDWNTTTYHAHRTITQAVGFLRRMMMGRTNVMMNHYPYPERFFERRLFKMIEDGGFEYRKSNLMGTPTMHHSFSDPSMREALGDIAPGWGVALMEWALKEFGGVCSMKADWFATRGVDPVDARVIYDLPHHEDRISDHDPITVDVRF